MQHTLGGPHGNGWNLNSNGEVHKEYEFPSDGEYVFRLAAFGQQAGTDLPKMALKIDDKVAKEWEVKAKEGRAETLETKVKVRGGKFKVAAAFTNDFYDKDNKDPRKRDRNLVVESIEIKGPLGQPVKDLPESHTRLVNVAITPGNRAAATKTILKNFASKAWRRPATDDEVRKLQALVQLAEKEGDTWERGLQLAVQGVLVSPHFLFKIELDPEQGKSKGPAYPISDFELATRLSYFLWSSLPDEELLKLARANTLRKFGGLDNQVKRMLKDERSQALVENFAGQWLQLRLLDQINPDPQKFPSFGDELRRDMRRETELFIGTVIREDKSLMDLLDADYTYVNERLAKHYGLSDVSGEEFRRVALKDDRRGGLLGQASILTVTSNPTRTSPVKRGKWILENLLNTPPPPPPRCSGTRSAEGKVDRLVAATDGATPREPGLRLVPRANGRARVRFGELRRDRRLARQGRRLRDRSGRRIARWQRFQNPCRIAGYLEEEGSGIPRLRHGKAADLRVGGAGSNFRTNVPCRPFRRRFPSRGTSFRPWCSKSSRVTHSNCAA